MPKHYAVLKPDSGTLPPPLLEMAITHKGFPSLENLEVVALAEYTDNDTSAIVRDKITGDFIYLNVDSDEEKT